jgi:hypothetical protein
MPLGRRKESIPHMKIAQQQINQEELNYLFYAPSRPEQGKQGYTNGKTSKFEY